MKSLLLLAVATLSAPLLAQQVQLGSGSVVQTVTTLRAGQFVWAPQVAPEGPMLLIVNLATQRALLFRNGVPIGASTVSTGKKGRETPTGVFTILQKQVEHYSSKYDNAPMPFMQRLTWQGVALHAGKLPGFAASHGCIRLPKGFAQLLYGVSSVGMTVVITDREATPRVAPAPEMLAAAPAAGGGGAIVEWNPEKSPTGPVSILVSTTDARALVLRNGIIIGSAPVTVEGSVAGTWAYALRNVDAQGQHWIRMQLSSEDAVGQLVSREEWGRFHAPDQFRRAVAAIVVPGTTVIVTTNSLRPGAIAEPVTVIASGPARR